MARTDLSLLGMTPARFLREHWQKKPLLVRGAFDGFVDPLSPEELAGLACEEGVESRLVRERGARRWEVSWGPHQESAFTSLPARRWTLLVQELNRHVPEAALLLERFAFLPSVRVDDVMVSYAPPGGSVGPHLDSYDVFLVQGMGSRRWSYGTRPTPSARFVPDLDLRILERFEPDAEAVLGPGDMLYLPPGFAHHGVAVEPCLTYSVGFRSPSTGEMWKDFAGAAARAAGPSASDLLVDPPLAPAANPGQIPPALLRRVRAAVRSIDTSDATIDRWFARFATRLSPGHTLTPLGPREARGLGSGAEVVAQLARGRELIRTEEGRWAFLPRPRGALLLYVAGEELEVPAQAAAAARAICASRRIDGPSLAPLLRSPAARALIVRLVSMGGLRLARASGR